jgi:TetR/AcrR family transcriptional regulator, cholesterol catabolism regulator
VPRALKNPDRPHRTVENSPRREEILTTAITIFAEKGFAGATMRDVADEVGILPGSLYHHFKSKDEILIEILRRYYLDIERDLREAVEKDRNAFDTLEEMLVLSAHYIIERKDEAMIALNELHYLDQSPKADLPALDAVLKSSSEAERIWLDVIRRGIRAKQFRQDIDPRLIFRTLIGANYGSVRWYDPDGEIGPSEYITQTTKLLLRGVQMPDGQSAADRA